MDCRCKKCGNIWPSRTKMPKQCPACKRYDWNEDLTKKQKKILKDHPDKKIWTFPYKELNDLIQDGYLTSKKTQKGEIETRLTAKGKKARDAANNM